MSEQQNDLGETENGQPQVQVLTRDATEVPTDLIHEADGLLSLVAHRYRVHDIPRDLCDELIACSARLRRIGEARNAKARRMRP